MVFAGRHKGRFIRAGLTAVVAGALVGSAPHVASAAVDDTVLASTGQSGASNGVSQYPSISDDGCRIAFQSYADNLAPTPPGDTNSGADVFVRDVCAGNTFRASVSDTEVEVPDPYESGLPAISGDGTKVAFATTAPNLDPISPENNGMPDLYLRDLGANTTRLVTINGNGIGAGGFCTVGNSATQGDLPAISYNGGHVAYSSATSAVTVAGATGDPNVTECDVFRRNMGATVNANVLISAPSGSNSAGNAFSDAPAISNDGSKVTFESYSDNLGEDLNFNADVFQRVVGPNTTTLVSRGPGANGVIGNDSSNFFYSGASTDGSVVVFFSGATNFDGGGPEYDVFARDMNAGTTELINRQSGTEGDLGAPQATGSGYDQRVSGDGRLVVFSAEDPLLAEGALGFQNVFVRDRLNKTTFVISRATGAVGAEGDGQSHDGDISANGRFIAFESATSNLSPADNNAPGIYDIFRREIFEPPAPTTAATLNLRPLKGTVLVTPPGGAPVPLEHSSQFPIGTQVDARQGRVELTSDFTGLKESMKFFEGMFRTQQTGADPVFGAKLSGPLKCKKKKKRGRERRARRALRPRRRRPAADCGLAARATTGPAATEARPPCAGRSGAPTISVTRRRGSPSPRASSPSTTSTRRGSPTRS